MPTKVRNKKWVSPDIAPLQPPTLATFRSWGSSAGAGRIELTRCKDTFEIRNRKFEREKIFQTKIYLCRNRKAKQWKRNQLPTKPQ